MASGFWGLFSVLGYGGVCELSSALSFQGLSKGQDGAESEGRFGAAGYLGFPRVCPKRAASLCYPKPIPFFLRCL